MILTKSLIIFSLIPLLCIEIACAQGDMVTLPGIPFKCSWENKPENFKILKDAFIISAGKATDMFRDPNATYNTDNAPKILFSPDSNFVLSVTIEHAFKNKWDGGAIVLKADNINWIKFCFEKDYKGAHRVVSVVTKDISDDCNSIAITGEIVHFKLARAGKVVTLYCSENGTDWLLVRHLQFESQNPLQTGFLAQSPTGDKCEVRFSNVKYEARKIKDPYLAE